MTTLLQIAAYLVSVLFIVVLVVLAVTPFFRAMGRKMEERARD